MTPMLKVAMGQHNTDWQIIDEACLFWRKGERSRACGPISRQMASLGMALQAWRNSTRLE